MWCWGRSLTRASWIVTIVACCAGATWAAGPVLAAAGNLGGRGGRVPGTAQATSIVIDGSRNGARFAGVGAISGGAGTSRLLMDYPAPQQAQILNYLFGPRGADLQILKLEIGGDNDESGGAEPSAEPSRGQIDCKSGDTWWLAEQAVARNPKITLMGLQWGAPGWAGADGGIWTQADIGYVLDWLRCAKSHHLTVSYIGGWDEHGFQTPWYKAERSALDANGFHSVKIIAADSFPGPAYDWQRTFKVAAAAAADPKFKAALSAIGVHDTCGGPTMGYTCESTPVARKLGLPLWESELGSLKGSTAAANMARSINNGFIQAGITGFLYWPLTDSSPPGLLQPNRSLVIANQPGSGYYAVQPITWAIAQTTQFTRSGWLHVPGASGTIGATGNYVAYKSPNNTDWSLVAENTGNRLSQNPGPQTIAVQLLGGLKTRNISVWSTDVRSTDPATWFVRQPDVSVSHGRFSYVIQPGYVVSFTSTTGQSRLDTTPPPSAPMTLPYSQGASPDAGNEPWGLATEEGAFVYEPCLGGATGVNGQCIEQRATQVPMFFQPPQLGPITPYAVVGDPGWANYTVSANVLFTTTAGSAGLISRFSNQGQDPARFDGYEFNLDADGNWQLLANAPTAPPRLLATGTVSPIATGTWHAISLQASGTTLTATIDGTQVGKATSSRWASGLAGIASNWTSVQFDQLKVQ